MKKKQYKMPVTVIVETRLDSLLYQASVPYGGPGDGETPDDAKEFADGRSDDGGNLWGDNLWGEYLWED